MTPDDWKRVKTIAGEAWTRPAGERTAYISSACASDEVLIREVSSLVAAMAAAEEHFEVPPQRSVGEPAPFASVAGRRLGAYEIVSRIGAGGMADVYKARDTRLDRIVAIKLLPARASADRVPPARMEREARAIAALNHPHICTLYDVGSQNGFDFLVMEYLEGETLAARLSRGHLPILDAVQYADQLASALSEAHRAGIVHRDVKPANIMLHRSAARPGGTPHVKLFDFGIAKADPSEASSAMTAGSEAALDLTLPGFLLGTVQYMAPEQIDGNATDARSDIFAFGAVLFEMLTGRRAFEGSNQAEVLAAIRAKDPPRVSSLRRRAPAALNRIVTKCLAKEPADRYQSVTDLAAEVRAVRRRLEASTRARLVMLALAVPALAIGGLAVWAVWSGDAGPTVPPSVTRLAASAGVLGAPALSPDGSSVVFSWTGEGIDNPELSLLRIGSATRVRLTNDPGVEEWPAWSPDGARIAFVRCAPGRCGIFTLPAGGGAERKLRELREDGYNGLAWSPDGRSIAYAERSSPAEPYSLFLLSTDTLVTRRLTTPPTGIGELRFAFSPDGGRLAVIRLGDAIGVYLVSTATGTATPLLSGQHEWFGSVAWSADGRFLILSANQQGVRHLWKLPVAGGALEQLAVAGEDAYFPSVSTRGDRLAFVRELRDWSLSKRVLNVPGEAPASIPFASSPRIDLDPAFSPDGGKLAFVSESGGTRELWVSSAAGGELRQLTSLRGPEAGKPSWSPDGRFLAFHGSGINVIPAGGGPLRKVSDDGEMPSWSADGRWIYFRRVRGGRFYVWKVPAEGGTAVQAIASEASVALEAPKGADLYFVRVEGGIWYRPVAGGPETLVIQDFKPSLPGYWTVASEGIYYVGGTTHTDRAVTNPLRFFDFASRRSVEVGSLAGIIDDWVGGLTLSRDRQTLIYSHRSYQSREVMLIDHFR
jgi:Tol biopolymer transport system component/tRNA A-37 threonylcarbamoyl transferase component Bud32